MTFVPVRLSDTALADVGIRPARSAFRVRPGPRGPPTSRVSRARLLVGKNRSPRSAA
ncbi:hypothetical protein ACFVG9_05260 [Saccharothrix carnea]|uniref:hypothetical protein n=1 Tax=Saccharothrix carnea TaxID=1280637 RepID=UPI00362E58D3